MTAQLVQFASVEQQIAQNKNLEDLVKLQNQNSEYAAVNYLGHNVQAEIDIADVSEDGASWGYVLDTPANTVDLHVVNSSGMRVYSTEGETELAFDTASNGMLWIIMEIPWSQVATNC